MSAPLQAGGSRHRRSSKRLSAAAIAAVLATAALPAGATAGEYFVEPRAGGNPGGAACFAGANLGGSSISGWYNQESSRFSEQRACGEPWNLADASKGLWTGAEASDWATAGGEPASNRGSGYNFQAPGSYYNTLDNGRDGLIGQNATPSYIVGYQGQYAFARQNAGGSTAAGNFAVGVYTNLFSAPANPAAYPLGALAACNSGSVSPINYPGASAGVTGEMCNPFNGAGQPTSYYVDNRVPHFNFDVGGASSVVKASEIFFNLVCTSANCGVANFANAFQDLGFDGNQAFRFQISDVEPPNVTSATTPGATPAWVNAAGANALVSTSISSRDLSGINGNTLVVDGATQVVDDNTACFNGSASGSVATGNTYNRYAPCLTGTDGAFDQAGRIFDGRTLNYNAAGLADGVHPAQLRTYDPLGNVRSFDFNIRVDKSAPTATAPASIPLSRQVTFTDIADQPGLSGVNANQAAAAAEFSSDNGATWQPLQSGTYDHAARTYTATVPASVLPGTQIRLRLRELRDVALNPATITSGPLAIPSAGMPSTVVDCPDGWFNTAQSCQVTGTAPDGFDVNTTGIDAAPSTPHAQNPSTVPVPVKDGINTVNANTTDLGGQTGPQASDTVRYDTQPPTGTPPTGTVPSSCQIQFTDITDQPNLSGLDTSAFTAQYSVDGGVTWKALTQGSFTNGTYTATIPAADCTPGTLKVRLLAKDNAGNAATIGGPSGSSVTVPAPPTTGTGDPAPGPGAAAPAACEDGKDNDGDGTIDAADPACHSDGNATNSASYTPKRTSEAGPCGDGKDNDGDGKIDAAQSSCHTDGNVNNPASYDPARDELTAQSADVSCLAGRLRLIDVYPQGGRVTLIGVAPRKYVGKTVRIRFAATGKTVATAKVQADQSFRTTAPMPPRTIRNTNRARYLATYGTERSLNLKLARRTFVTRAEEERAGYVRFSGRVIRPLGKTVQPVKIRMAGSCPQAPRGPIVATVTPKSNGTFTALIKVPARYRQYSAVYLRAQSRVRKNTRNAKLYPTFSLVRGVAVTPGS